MKAIIPVAGTGKRLRPFTYTQPKPLIPVAGKPILSYIIDQLLELEIRELVFVIGYLGEKIQNFVEENYPQIDAKFIRQTERRGSGHAVWLAKEAIGEDEDVVVVYGDTMIEGPVQQIVGCSQSCMAIKRVEDPRRFGVVELNPDGTIARMVEKPRMPKSNKALVGFYKIHDCATLMATLGDLLEHQDVGEEEITLTDGLMVMLDAGHEMHTEMVDRWYDCGNSDVLLQTNRVLLEKQGYAESQTPSFDDTIFIHPVSIGKGCDIKHAIIGPHVTVGDYAKIDRVILADSIVGRHVRLDNVSLQHSVVGNDTSLTGQPQTINIGDNTELSLG